MQQSNFTDIETQSLKPVTPSRRITRELEHPQAFGNETAEPFTSIPFPIELQSTLVKIRQHHDMPVLPDTEKDEFVLSDAIELLTRPEDTFTTTSKSWRLRWRWDYERQQLLIGESADGGSNLPTVLSRKSTQEVLNILWHRKRFEKVCAQLKAENVEIDPENIIPRWKDRTGIASEMKKDLPYFIALYQHISDTKSTETTTKYFKDYYSRVSLKRTINDEGKFDRDPENWRVACALAIAGGMSEADAFSLYKIKTSEKNSPQEKVRKLVVQLQAAGTERPQLEAIYKENARIIGRLVVHSYAIQREQAIAERYPDPVTRVKRVVAEITMMLTLVVCPEDPEMRIIESLSDEDIHTYITKAF